MNGTGIDLSGLFNGTFDLSSLLNGTGIDISGWFNGTNGTFDIFKLLEILFGAEEHIISEDLLTYQAKTIKYAVTVMAGDEPVTKGNVVFTINNKKYPAEIGSDGVASVDLNKLKPGTYFITSSYGEILNENMIVVERSVITKNVAKKYKKTGKFKVKVLDNNGKPKAKQTVKIKIKGKVYKAKTNAKGKVTFKLPKSLKVGKYVIKTSANGVSVKNKLVVKK